jgi:hypothetical protein
MAALALSLADRIEAAVESIDLARLRQRPHSPLPKAIPDMTYLEVAITVLEASPRPMDAPEILAEIRRRKLIPLTGRTPDRVLAAALYRNLGKHPRLRRHAKQGRSRAARGSVRWYVAP